jgi:polar amino acid transport system permease protein
VEPIQNESAISLGMNSRQVLGYVILPQAMSTSIPAFVANIIFLLKETSVFSTIHFLYMVELVWVKLIFYKLLEIML